MKKLILLPGKYKLIGAILFPFAATWLLLTFFGDYTVFPFLKYFPPSAKHDLINPEFIFSKGFSADFNGGLSILATLVSLFMIAFSREKEEDEYVRAVRLQSLQISIYVNYIFMALGGILLYGFSYLLFLQLNLFTILIIFILVFNYNLHLRDRIFKTGRA